MQTKHEIQALLAAQGASANTRYGQHFLIDLNLMRLMVDSARLTRQDVVLEVGCGTGSITGALAEQAGQIVAVDIDTTLAGIARTQLASANNVTVLNCDILKNKHTLQPAVIEAVRTAQHRCRGRLLLVANLPYHVASAVIVNGVVGPTVMDAMVVTVQKEVAERMTAIPGTHSYGSLSIWLGCTGDVALLRILKPSVFWPPPQVDSALVRFVRHPQALCDIRDVTLLRDVMELFLGHRRKMLKACTKTARGRLAGVEDWPALFERCRIEPTQRPDQIAPEQYIALSNAVYDSTAVPAAATNTSLTEPQSHREKR